MKTHMLLAIVIAAISCADPTVPVPTLTGTYHLVSVNGRPLPAVVASIPPEVVQVTGGEITLAGDGTYTAVSRWRIVTGPPINTVVDDSSASRGTYTLRDSTLTLSVLEPSNAPRVLTIHAGGVLTEFFRRSELGGPYRDVTYRYERRRR